MKARQSIHAATMNLLRTEGATRTGRGSGGRCRFPIAILLVSGLLVTFLVPAATLAATPAQKCAAGKQKAAGNFAKKALVCSAKGAKKGLAVDTACLTKAEDKFRAKLAKLEGKE